jgi:excisionase family DNA binding protein
LANLLTPSQVASKLQCSVTTVRTMVRNGQLPHIQIGDGKQRVTVRIPESALSQFEIATPDPMPELSGGLERLHPAIARAISGK